MSEREFQRQVLQLARMFGYSVYHTYQSTRSNPGYPDLALWKPGRHLYAELKTDTGKLSAEQTQTLEELRAAGQEVYLWRPRDLQSIAEILANNPKRES